MVDPVKSPRLAELETHLLNRWPEHAAYLCKSLEGRDETVMTVCEQLAEAVLTLGEHMVGGVDELIDDYRYLCETIVLPEELYFRRHGAYRLSKFEDAERECYANATYMNRYMNGLLVSNVVWSNHAHAFSSYVRDYLPRLGPDAAHLEIGPGHGLFLLFAARCTGVGKVEGWDISPTSINNTRAALSALGVDRPVSLRLENLFDAAAAGVEGNFDSIVMSEILEHLEDPVSALRAVSRHIKPGGLVWINVPANSPAPDHIFLVNGLDHACALAEQAGLEIVASSAFPMSGVTLEKAIKRKMAVSCVVTARKALIDGIERGI